MQVGSETSPERKRANEVFRFIIKPALEEFGIEPYRADLDLSPGGVTPTLLRELLEARLIVADLTGRNPNVFYELGISHSFARPLVCIADSASHLPFDAKDERVIQLGDYPDTGLTYAQGETAKASLVETLKIALQDGYVPPSPLQSVGAVRSLDQLATSDPVAAEVAEMREVLDEIRENVKKVRLAIPQAVLADLDALHQFVEDHMLAVTSSRIEDLKTDETSARHDAWVDNVLKERARQDQARQPDPWSSSSDEPPF